MIPVSGPLTLSEEDRRLLALWAADCAERALPVFESFSPSDPRPREAIEGARAFARAELRIGPARKLSAAAHAAARDVADPAAIAAARAAGHAVAVAHMGAHARGVAYAAKAISLSLPLSSNSGDEEVRWQLAHASDEVKEILRKLPMPKRTKGELGHFMYELFDALHNDRTPQK